MGSGLLGKPFLSQVDKKGFISIFELFVFTECFMCMKFQTYNGKVIYADTPEEFIIQFCKGDLLTQEMSVQECMDDYASKAKEHNNIHIPTDNPRNFINALYRMGYVVKLD